MPSIKAVPGARVIVMGSLLGCFLTLLNAPLAMAAPNCTEFFSNADGSWSPTHPIMYTSPTAETPLLPSDRFRRGMPGLSGRIAALLDRNCRYARSPSPLSRISKVP